MISLDKTKDICNIYYIYNKIGLGKELIDEYDEQLSFTENFLKLNKKNILNHK